jgi:predicted nucleic acid-binding protein
MRPICAVHAIAVAWLATISYGSGALIVAAALDAGCELLFTEDLQHGHQFGSVTVQNPFRR